MLYTTTLVVEQEDRTLSDLGIEKGEIKYYPLQIDIGEIYFHHAFDHETDDGLTPGTIIRFKQGGSVATLAPFEEIEKLRLENEE